MYVMFHVRPISISADINRLHKLRMMRGSKIPVEQPPSLGGINPPPENLAYQ